ncbi:MAG: hypothetical protein IJW55_04580 [Clostridia bacterium]|nr:hypothetical protein [Clostridia bacterium]
MKKRILALLLAGILTASLASCVTTKDRNPGDDTGTGTEAYQTRDDGTGTTAPTPVTWTDVDETVYVTASSMTLIGVENASNTVVVKQVDKLQRIKLGSNKKDIVVKDGVQYYADHANLTNADLLGETMTTCNKTTMYANGSANIRKYANSEYVFSSIIKTLSINETVTVVAKGDKWYKIEYQDGNATKNYFVFASLLSNEKVTDPDDLDNYNLSVFTDCDPYLTKYVSTYALACRVAPSRKATAQIYLSEEDAVTVVATGMIDGMEWSKVIIPKEESEGTGLDYYEGYVASDCLAETKGGVSKMTLAQMLAQYDNFKALDTAETMYVVHGENEKYWTVNLNVRSTPEFPKDNSNIVGSVTTKDAVKVVATGDAAETVWAMIEYGEGEYYFVSYKYLTTDPDGDEAPLTLDQLIAMYPAFTKCTEKTVYANKVVNCNTAPVYQTEVSEKLEKGEAVTVVAEGKVKYVDWYIFKTAEGNYYFAGQDLFSESAQVG